MAGSVGIGVSSVQRIWRAHGLRPHRVHLFRISIDPAFTTKLRDIVGFYVDPPAHAVVLSLDESCRSKPSTAPSRPCRSRRAAARP
jgi:hypothetical protein